MNLNNKIKVICFDYDGTLVPIDHKMSEETKRTLNKLKENGYKLGLVSGRLGHSVCDCVGEYVDPKIFDYVFGMNGLEIYDQKTKQSVFPRYMPKEDIKYFYNCIKDLDYVTFGFYKGNDLYIDKVCNESLINRISKKTVVKFFDFDKIDFDFPSIFFAHDVKDREKFDQYFKDKIVVTNYDYFRSMPHCVEIVPKNAGKDNSIEYIMNKESITNKEIMAFGDEDNDVKMLKACVGVAMGNGSKNVKEVSQYMTDDVLKGGITKFLKENHFLD